MFCALHFCLLFFFWMNSLGLRVSETKWGFYMHLHFVMESDSDPLISIWLDHVSPWIKIVMFCIITYFRYLGIYKESEVLG
jgi:hypothetical protein